VESAVAVKPSYGLGDDEIARMLQESFAAADVDMDARALLEARVEAERLLLATRAALTVDGDLLARDAAARIEGRMQELARAATGTDANAIQTAVDALADATEGFAAARMNRGIRAALTGRRVDEV
jgi:molecular chaperone HscA